MDNAVKVTHEIKADLIILFTDEINFAKCLSKFRPPCLIACPTKSEIVSRFLRLYRGVIPFIHKDIEKTQEIIDNLIEIFVKKDIIDKNIKILMINAYMDEGNSETIKNFLNNGMFIINTVKK